MDKDKIDAAISDIIGEVNAHFGMPERWHLQQETRYNDVDPEIAETSFQASTMTIDLSWGRKESRPNGFHGVWYKTKDFNPDDLREQAFKTALQSALVLGRDQELRENGCDLASLPLWARASRPIFARVFAAHTRIKDPERLYLAQQTVEENGAVLAPRTGYWMDEHTCYEFNWWKGNEAIHLEHKIPEAVIANLENMTLSQIISIEGIDFSNLEAEISVLENDKGEAEGLVIDFKRSDLVRLAPPPAGVEPNPVTAWLAAARRTTEQ